MPLGSCQRPNTTLWGALLRILIVADVHANLAALEAVLADARRVDEVWSLGDLVGYGPDPNEVVDRLRGLPLRSLAGNHDWGSIGKAELTQFNEDARSACAWTASVLREDLREYLAELAAAEAFGSVYAAHGSPRDPIWEYITNIQIAQANFGYFSTNACLVGHTHVPVVFRWRAGVTGADAFVTEVPSPGTAINVDGDRLIFNPGSVGQPRDGDPRAAYAILESATQVFTFRRVAYDIGATQAKMREVGLPERLAPRLEYGW